MDRKAWIAIILSVAALFGWQWYYARKYPVRPTPPAAAAAKASPTAVPSASPTPGVAATLLPNATPVPPTLEARTESLVSGKNDNQVEYIFSNDQGGIERAILIGHRGENGKDVFLNGRASMPIGAIGETPGEPWGGFHMTTDLEKGEATFTRRDEDGLEVIKRFTVPESGAKNGSYLMKMTLEFRNTGDAEVTRKSYFISSGGAAPVHARDLPMNTRFDWNHGGKFTTIDVNWFNAGGIPWLGVQWSPLKALYEMPAEKGVNWVGVASQYFCSIVTPEKTKGTGVWSSRYETQKLNNTPVYGIQGGMFMPGFTLKPQESQTESFLIYAGPKYLEQLRKMKEGQDAVMNFGMFGWVSEPLLWGMNKLKGLLGSYAAAIIALTLIIKTLLWPIQNKATNEMRRMAALSPKMTEMREKYKDDPQKMNEEMMKMYREYGVNPLSGCLPMLIQIPIFFGFYAMLGSAIQLRNSSFFWVTDLSQPDTVGHILGFPINVLPIVMAGTMVWQMVITPKSGDAMQQRMMYFMPIIFLAFAYNYASGLALYWTTQNIFSIVQLYATRNKPLPTLEKKSDVAKRVALAAKKKKKRPGQ